MVTLRVRCNPAYLELDNFGRTTGVEQYDGDNVTISDANSGVPDKPSASLLRAKATALYDDQGRIFQTRVFSVDQSNGNVSSTSLRNNVWYGRRGQVLKTSAPGGLVLKSEYDGAGRVVKSYVTDGGGDIGWSDADDVTGDAVLEQTENAYDADSNVIMVTLRQRFHDEAATGALNNPTTAPKARVSYVTAYYDMLGLPSGRGGVVSSSFGQPRLSQPEALPLTVHQTLCHPSFAALSQVMPHPFEHADL